MRVEVVQEPSALLELSEIWAALHAVSRSATFYNTPQWAQLWWRHFGEADALRLFLVRDDDNQLVGLAPMYLDRTPDTGTALRYLGGLDVSDYLDTLALPEHELEVADALAAAWIDLCCCEDIWVDLYAMPNASPMREAFFAVAPSHGLHVSGGAEEMCPVLELPPTWDGYLEHLDRRARHELRRKVRKAGQEALVSWYQVRGGSPEALADAMETFFTLHQRSGPDKADFMSPRMRAFFLDLAQTVAAMGHLLLDVLLVNGRPAATYLSFDYRGQVMLYNSGYDPHIWPEISPGWILLAYRIEHAIALGRQQLDFLRGDEEYKFRFGGKTTWIHRLKLEPASLPECAAER